MVRVLRRDEVIDDKVRWRNGERRWRRKVGQEVKVGEKVGLESRRGTKSSAGGDVNEVSLQQTLYYPTIISYRVII